MTQGPILRQLVFFSFPLMLGNVFQLLYNMVDSIIVGNFVSKQALAAIGSTTVIVSMIVFFFSGFATGAGVVIGNNFGARNMDRLHDAVHTTVAATFIFSLLLTLLGTAAVRPMLVIMRTPEDVFRDAALYLRIYIGGISGLLIYNMGSGILRAVGDSIRPLGFLILTSVLNILLDLFFVIVLKLGIAGAAVATILSQFVSAALILLLLTRTRDIYRLDWKELHIDFPILKKIFSIGMPTALQAVITSFSNIFVQGYINAFGSDVMAGWSCYNKLDHFIFLPMQSMSVASTTFVSQNAGAGNERRSRRGTFLAILITCLVIGVTAAVLTFFAPAAVRMFSPDEAVIRYGAMFIRTNAFFLIFNGIAQVLAGALRGRGDSRGPMVIMLFNFVVVRQIYLYWVTHFVANTPRLVGFGYPVGWVLCCVMELIYAWCRLKRSASR
jgi:putative MATE family efflux protein